MPTANAKPPNVITLIVSPSAANMQIDVRIDNGMEIQTINVLRQLPRNNRIINAVKNAAIPASRRTSLMDVRTKID